ncbi:RNA exonuclease 5 [Stigmatopora argus]
MDLSFKMSSSFSTPFDLNKRKRNGDHIHHCHTAKRLKSENAGVDEAEKAEPRITVFPNYLSNPIKTDELTELLHCAALGGTNAVKQPSWCSLHGQKYINVVVVEGVSQSDFYRHYIILNNLRTKYSNRLSFTSSSSSCSLLSTIFNSQVDELEQSSVSQEQKDNSMLHKVLRTHPVVLKFGTKKRGPTAYMLTQEDLIKKHYPVKGLPGFEDFAVIDCDNVTDDSPLFGLDCEMCLTVRGYELTRVSLVNGEGTCLMDELVKPDNKILDYLTEFSGITAAMLHSVTTTLRNVQVMLRKLLPRNAILVGHTIDNDLVALKLIHPHVIDTSLLYRGEFGRKFKLKLLAEVALGRRIQTQEEKGHHPVEDALAALDLAKYFISKSPPQVVEDHLEELWGLTMEEDDTACQSTEPAPSRRFGDVLKRLGRSVSYVGKRSDLVLDLANQQWHNTDKQVLASFRRRSTCPFFSVLGLSSFTNVPPLLEHKLSCHLRDLCVVFAGPFPTDFSEKEVRRLFRCCGSVRTVKMLNTMHRTHAMVEFKLLEGASLALQMLNGATVRGHTMKVHRPVNESTLDFDVTLDALKSDAVNACRLYTVKLNFHTTGNGHDPVGEFAVNGHSSASLPVKKSELSEEALIETFSRFGVVERVLLGKCGTHAYIQFGNSEGKRAAVESWKELWKEKYIACPALTPAHIACMRLDESPRDPTDQTHQRLQDLTICHMMKKMDVRVGKIFKSLPENTLSVVLLLKHNSAQQPPSPGLCLLEMKREKS